MRHTGNLFFNTRADTFYRTIISNSDKNSTEFVLANAHMVLQSLKKNSP